MAGLVSKLLLLIAVLLMPVGMSAAPAAEASSAHDDGHHAMTMQHCPGEDSQPGGGEAGIGACAMACAAALPAFDAEMVSCAPLARLPAASRTIVALAGLNPESADPPPRHS
jgi:hypothetical protein